MVIGDRKKRCVGGGDWGCGCMDHGGGCKGDHLSSPFLKNLDGEVFGST